MAISPQAIAPDPDDSDEGHSLDPVRRLIVNRMREKGLRMRTVSRLMGRNEAYMSQFIGRRVPERLSEETRSALAKLLDLDERALRIPPPQSRQSTATPLLDAAPPRPSNVPDGPAADLIPIYTMKSAVGGAPIAWAQRLSPQTGVPNAYALMIDADRGRLRAGDLAFVNPTGELRPGDSVVAVKNGSFVTTGDFVEHDGERATLRGGELGDGQPVEGVTLARVVAILM